MLKQPRAVLRHMKTGFSYGNFFRASMLLVFCALMSACASQSVFTPYPVQAESLRQALSSGSVSDDTLNKLKSRAESNDELLYVMELGRVHQLRGEYKESKEYFARAAAIFDKQDLEATLSARDMAASGASLLTNDNALPYSGAGYERIAVHHFQALNYWALGDIEGAAVEFRKVALEQEFLAQKHEKAIRVARNEAQEENIDLDSLQSQFAGLDTLAGSVKSSFLNPYTYYTSAAFRESVGELNDALVDYKKALEMHPQEALLRESVSRVAERLGESVKEGTFRKAGADEAELFVFFEQGFIPQRNELPINIPTFRGAFVSVAFPFYSEKNWVEQAPLSVSLDSGKRWQTTALVDYGSLAVRNLQEQLPSMLVRQTLRAISKYQLQRQSGENFGLLGQFVANVYTIISERADLRSWLTLPQAGQVARIILPAGRQRLFLETDNGSRSIELDLAKGRKAFLHVVSSRQLLHVQELKL